MSINLKQEQKLHLVLPPQLVLEKPILREFAARLDEIRAKSFVQSGTSYIFPLHECTGNTPVFFCGVDLTLARNWALPCTLYAIAYWEGGGKLVEMDTIEGLAARYIQGIKGLRSNGPYRIGGYSFGGVVALEIA